MLAQEVDGELGDVEMGEHLHLVAGLFESLFADQLFGFALETLDVGVLGLTLLGERDLPREGLGGAGGGVELAYHRSVLAGPVDAASEQSSAAGGELGVDLLLELELLVEIRYP